MAGPLEWRPGWDPRWDPIEIQVLGLASTSKPKASAWCFEPLFFTPAVPLEPPAATDELHEELARAEQERVLLPNPMENQCFCGRPLFVEGPPGVLDERTASSQCVCAGTNRYQGAPSHTNAEQIGLETPCAAGCAQRLRKFCKEAILKSRPASSS